MNTPDSLNYAADILKIFASMIVAPFVGAAVVLVIHAIHQLCSAILRLFL